MRRKVVLLALVLGLVAGSGVFAAGPAGLSGIGIFGSAGQTGGTLSGGLGISLKWQSFPVIGFKYDFKASAMNVSCDYYAIDAEAIASKFSYFLGAGAYIGLASGSEFDLGLRLPVGLQFWPIKKLEIYLSPVVSVPIYPSPSFGVGGELGLRVHF